MHLRFQFSLATALIAVGLLGAVAASVHQALRLDPDPNGFHAPVWGDVRYSPRLRGAFVLYAQIMF